MQVHGHDKEGRTGGVGYEVPNEAPRRAGGVTPDSFHLTAT